MVSPVSSPRKVVMQLKELIGDYLRWRASRGDAQKTLEGRRLYLKHFLSFLIAERKETVEALTPQLLKEFQVDLAFKMTREGKFYTASTRNHIHGTVKDFCRRLYREDYLAVDLSEQIESLREPRRLPKNILDEREMYEVLQAPDMTTPMGYRDRVMMELFYGTGIRRNELCHLRVSDVDIESGTLFIAQGKGGKDRVVPLGDGLCEMLRHYLTVIRPQLLPRGDHDALIPSLRNKGPLSPRTIGERVKEYGRQSGTKKRVYPHLFRHTCATHMTQHGAPIRCVQELLGHAQVNTTQIYTHVAITDLKKAHAKYHPRERMKLQKG